MEATEILQIVEEWPTKNGESSTTFAKPLQECGLDNVDCPMCRNSGYKIIQKPDGTIAAQPCECMAKRVAIRNLERSGLKDMIGRYTFGSYKTPGPKHVGVKLAAENYCKTKGAWFYISGKSGSGKTHICTAICSRLMDQGRAVRYMLWRDASAELKSYVMDGDEYQEKIKPLKRVSVLYIDDFFKGGATDADIRLAFEILNARYNDKNLRTILSSERTLGDIIDLDEALGGRIYERAKGFVVQSPAENWRLK